MQLESPSQNVIKSFNTGLFVSMCLIFILGIVTLYSATNGPGNRDLAKTQFIYFGVGLVMGAVLIFIDSQILSKIAYISYAICFLLLAAVLIVGHVGNGSQRWLNLGFFRLQPSEFAKLSIILALAKYFAEEKIGPPYTLKKLWVAAALVLPYFVLILKQPDMGTAGILFLTAASIVLFVGVHWKSILIVVISGLVALPVVYRFGLHEYQQNRVKTFLDPERDPRNTGYNALQCKIAVGSGQITGKGYLKGTQAQLNFIPEQHTDFIFSVFAEERGLIGALLLLTFYGMYCFYALQTVSRARDKFEMLVAIGLTALMFWHVFVNIGMVSGILPIVGVTLPMFSYGGSSLFTFMIATALLLNISRKRYIF